MLNNKYAFLEALVIAVFVFSAGIAIGVYFENNRSGQIQNLYYDYEITVSDVSASLDILSSSNQSCNQVWTKLLF